MKTQEFVKEVEKLGYRVFTTNVDGWDILEIRLSNMIMGVYLKREFIYLPYPDFQVSLTRQEQLELFNLVVEYVKTPIADREEEKLYLLSLPNCSYKTKYLEINIDNQKEYRIKTKPKTKHLKIAETYVTGEVKRFQMVFTKSEIKELDNQRFIQSLHTGIF